MSINTFYLKASDKLGGSFQENLMSEFLIVANNVKYCELVTCDAKEFKFISEDKLQETAIHFIDGSVLYTNQSLKFINKLLTRNSHNSEINKNE